MDIAEIWRYPVKSMQGEHLAVGEETSDGLVGDREWGLVEGGKVLTGRRAPELLGAAATWRDGEVEVRLPDGRAVPAGGPGTDDAVAGWLGRPASLRPARELPALRAETYADPTDDSSEVLEWTMPQGRFVDALPLLLVTTASLRAGAALHPDGRWDVRRFRPNVLIDADGNGWVEDDWVERRVRIGNDVVVVPQRRCGRCTMVTRPQPGIDRDLDIFRTLHRHHDAKFGVWATVEHPGTIRPGDPVVVD
jgi:uncharacterized protein YcbX